MKRFLLSLILVIGLTGLSMAQNSDYIKVKATGFTLKNTENGMRQATPEVMLWNTSNASVNTTVSYLLYNPEGALVTKSGDCSSKKEAELRPGQNKVELPNLLNCRADLFIEGNYSYKVNVNGQVVCQGVISYEKQVAPVVTTQPEQPIAEAPVTQPEVKEEPKVEQPQQVTVVTPEPVKENPVVAPTNDKPFVAKPKPEPMKLHFGINGGVAFSSFRLSADGVMSSAIDYSLTGLDEFKTFEAPNYQFNIGFDGGLFVQIPLIKDNNLFLETGAQYSRFSYTNEFRSSNFSTNEFNLWMNFEDVSFKINYGNVETYTLNCINVPVMFGYEFAITELFHIDLKMGPVLNLIATADLGMDGYSNCEIYTTLDNGQWGYYGIGNSTITGSADLMTGKYDFTQKFSTGAGSTYKLTNTVDPIPVYNRINASLRFGANIGVGPVALEVTYDLGLTNMANSAYWENCEGARIPGLILFGDSFYSMSPIKGYKQRLGVLSAGLSVRF